MRATVFVHPLPNEVFVPVTGALGLGRSTGGSGSRTPFRRAAKPGSRPGTGTAPPRATFSPRAPPPGAARTGPPCKVAACLLVEEVARGPLKPRLRILMACARDSLERKYISFRGNMFMACSFRETAVKHLVEVEVIGEDDL